MSPPRSLLLAMVVWLSAACVMTRPREADAPVAEPPATQDGFIIPTQRDESAGSPKIEVTELEGVDRERAEQWLGAVEEPLRDCKPTQPGLVHIAIVSRKSETKFIVTGATALDAATLECIMAAMALVDVEVIEPVLMAPPAATKQLSPSDTPPTVQSQVTISW